MPPIAPNQTNTQGSVVVQELRKNPMLTSTPPITEIQNGPFLSWSRPARTNEMANTNTAMVKIREVSARFHPNSFSSGLSARPRWQAPREAVSLSRDGQGDH